MALLPTLAVAMLFGGGHSGLDALNSMLNVVQSLVLPFAVVPLLIFAGSERIMGDFVLSRPSLIGNWAATILILSANVYLFYAASSSSLIYFVIVVYISCVVYVAWAADVTRPPE